MFLEIFSLYIQGLLLAIVFALLVGGGWIFWRANRKLDKTVKERQAFLYEVFMMVIMTVPILSFAFVAIIMIFRA